MLRSVLPALAAVAAVMLGPTAVPAVAQGMQQQAPAAAEYGEEELRAFAQASLEVQELNDKWIPRLSEAESQEEAQQLRSQATAEMAEAIQDEGLSLEDYNAIYDQARQDAELASQIRSYQQEAR